MCLLGCAVLMSGFDQPLVLLVLSACLNGIVMFIYSILLIKLNRDRLAAGDPGQRASAWRRSASRSCSTGSSRAGT